MGIICRYPTASIIIRAKNEGRSLATLLPLLYAQQTNLPFEVILLDNASTDQTSEIVRAYPQVITHLIPEGQFHFSKSLNMGARIARGQILVHLSAHCFPVSHYWLKRLVSPLLENPHLVATYGRQFTDPHVNAYEQKDWSDLFFPSEGAPRLQTFSNANAAVRRRAVLEHSFDEDIPLLEDHLWYLEQEDRSKILYVPKAAVLHLHPLFNLKYYKPRWAEEGVAATYINEVKKIKSPMTSFNRAGLLYSPQRLLPFVKTAYTLIRRGLIMYGLFALPFYLLRDYQWKKGLKIGKERFANLTNGS